jgi:hypothetical protein
VEIGKAMAAPGVGTAPLKRSPGQTSRSRAPIPTCGSGVSPATGRPPVPHLEGAAPARNGGTAGGAGPPSAPAAFPRRSPGATLGSRRPGRVPGSSATDARTRVADWLRSPLGCWPASWLRGAWEQQSSPRQGVAQRCPDPVLQRRMQVLRPDATVTAPCIAARGPLPQGASHAALGVIHQARSEFAQRRPA